MVDTPAKDEFENAPASAPERFVVSLRGFGNEAEAREFGTLVGETLRAISSFINLERLDGVTVAYDYDDALTQLDRGYTPSRQLTRTTDSRLLGVAMTATVLRDGIVKAHLLFDAPFVLPLREGAGDHFNQALYLVAHECGHVEDLKDRDESFPGVILREPIASYEDALLEQVVSAIWEEYAASRFSASFGRGQYAAYEESFISVLTAARREANAAIRSYRWHADIPKVLQEAGNSLWEPLRLAAYLLGHLDGIDEGLDIVPKARDALASSPYKKFIERLLEVVRDLWSRRGRWQSRGEFFPLHDLGRDVLAWGGLILKPLPDGSLYVDIPFTPETMPWTK
jgi:hypothetical protein